MLDDVRGDWLLKFLYRTASVQMRVAGLQAIDWRDRRMQNVDLTDVVSEQKKTLSSVVHRCGVQSVK